MRVKKSRAFLPKIATFVFIIMVSVYTAYHLVNLFLSEDVETIVSGVVTESDSVSGTGYIFRDEKLVSAGFAGAVDYLVRDGEKVSVDQEIANVYEVESQSDGLLAKRMLFLTDKQISLLEKSVISGADAVDLASLRSDAGDTYNKILNLIADKDTSELDVQIENMRVTMNKMDVLTGGSSKVTASLDILRSQRSKYLVGECVPQKAKSSGYFYYTPDGFESKFKLSALEDMTANDFYSLIHDYETNKPKISSSVYGKIAETTKWNFVMPLSESKAVKLEDKKEYKLTFKENNNVSMTMTLTGRINAESRKEVILIFECNQLPENFSLERCQNADVELSSVDGIYVPHSSIARVDGIRGVYVLRGSVVYFRKIDIIYNGSDYCLVAENGEGEGDYKYLENNELIITNGKNLFDGRVMG